VSTPVDSGVCSSSRTTAGRVSSHWAKPVATAHTPTVMESTMAGSSSVKSMPSVRASHATRKPTAHATKVRMTARHGCATWVGVPSVKATCLPCLGVSMSVPHIVVEQRVLQGEVGVTAPVLVHGVELLATREQPPLRRLRGRRTPHLVSSVVPEALVPEELLERQDGVRAEVAVHRVVLVPGVPEVLLEGGPLVLARHAVGDEDEPLGHPRRATRAELAVPVPTLGVPLGVLGRRHADGRLDRHAHDRALDRLPRLARREAELLEGDARVVGRTRRPPAPELQMQVDAGDVAHGAHLSERLARLDHVARLHVRLASVVAVELRAAARTVDDDVRAGVAVAGDGVLLAVAVPDRPDRAAEHRAEVDTGLVRLGRGEVDAVVVVPGAGLRVDAPAPLAGDPADDRADRVRTGPLQAERP